MIHIFLVFNFFSQIFQHHMNEQLYNQSYVGPLNVFMVQLLYLLNSIILHLKLTQATT